MRTCKGTASSRSPNDEAFRSQVRLANTTKAATSEGAQSSRSASPALSAASYPSSPQQASTSGGAARGVSPDPTWGPNPLASWQPTKRRHTLSSYPMPISQKVYLGNLPVYNNVGASPTTTPSPSSLVPLMAVSSGTPPGSGSGSSDSRTSDPAGVIEGGGLHRRDRSLDWLTGQMALSRSAQPLFAGSAALRGSHIPSIPSSRHASSSNSVQCDTGDSQLVSPEPVGPNSYGYDLMPSTSHWSNDGLSTAANSPADEEAFRYFVMMKRAVPGWTPSPPPAAGTATPSHFIGSSNATGAYTVTRAVESQEDAMRREQDAQGESLWNAYVDLE